VIIVGFELASEEFPTIFSLTATQIASKSFLQFDDISAKFSTTGRASGSMVLANIGSLSIENATIAFAFGLGIVEISEKIYFKDISSTIQALIQNAQWQTAGVMDITIPVTATITLGGLGLTLNPIISITSPDLFSPDYPSMSIDLKLE
jgi:hypothetical protein